MGTAMTVGSCWLGWSDMEDLDVGSGASMSVSVEAVVDLALYANC